MPPPKLMSGGTVSTNPLGQANTTMLGAKIADF